MHRLEVRWRRLNKEENRNEMFFRGNFLLLQKGGANSNTDFTRLP